MEEIQQSPKKKEAQVQKFDLDGCDLQAMIHKGCSIL